MMNKWRPVIPLHPVDNEVPPPAHEVAAMFEITVAIQVEPQSRRAYGMGDKTQGNQMEPSSCETQLIFREDHQELPLKREWQPLQ
jgi:hypothetical protein